MYRPPGPNDYSSTSSNHQFPSEYRQNNHYYVNQEPQFPSRMRSQSADSRRMGFQLPEHLSAPDPPQRQFHNTTSSNVSFPSSSFRRGDIADDLDMGAHLPAATGSAQQQFNNHAHFTQQLRERSPTSSSALLNLLQRYPSARQSVFNETQPAQAPGPRIIRSENNHRLVDTHVYRPTDATNSYPLVEVAAYRTNGQSGLPAHLTDSTPANYSFNSQYSSAPGYPAGTLPHNFRLSEVGPNRNPLNPENSNYLSFSNNNINNINNISANNWPPEFQEFAQLDSLLNAVIGGEDMSKTTSEWRNSFAQMQDRFKNRVADAQESMYHPAFTSSGATLPRRGAGQMLVKSSSHHAFPEHSMLSSAVERRAAEAPEVRRSGAIDQFWTNSVAKAPTSPPIQRIPTSLTAAERLQMLQEPANGRPATPVVPPRVGSGTALAARREYYLNEATPPISSERDRLTPSFTRTFSSSPNFSELDSAVNEMNSEVRRTGYSLGARRLGGCARFPTDEAAFSPPRTLAPATTHRGLHSASPTDSVSETSSVYQIPTGLPHPKPKHNLKEQLHQAGIQSTYFPRMSPRPGPNFPVPSTGSVASRITEFERRPGTPTLQISTTFANERHGSPMSIGPMSPRSTVFRSKPVIHVDMGTHHERSPHVASTHFDYPMTVSVCEI